MIIKDLTKDSLKFLITGQSDLLVCSLNHYRLPTPRWLLKYCG